MADIDASVDGVALGRVREICRGFAGADEGELQNRPLFRVGRRRFAIFNGTALSRRPRWSSSGRSLHFVADPLELDALHQDNRFVRSPHHGDRGWLALSLEDPEAVDWDEVRELLGTAYRHVTPRSSPSG